jgi:hypothetical protein
MTDVELCDLQDWFEPLMEWSRAKYRTVCACVDGPLTIRHEIFGNPFHPLTIDQRLLVWNSGTGRNLAEAIYDDRAFDRLPILADALEDAGCTDADILAHCRGGGEHVRGCWVVDLLTGRE